MDNCRKLYEYSALMLPLFTLNDIMKFAEYLKLFLNICSIFKIFNRRDVKNN